MTKKGCEFGYFSTAC